MPAWNKRKSGRSLSMNTTHNSYKETNLVKGLDRWVLPAIGTPWRPGYIFREAGENKSAPIVKQSNGVKP